MAPGPDSTRRPRVAVIGQSGQLARALTEAAAESGCAVVCLGRPQLDLEHPSTVAPALAQAAADIVINTAAYTAVDKAESESDLAFRINRDGAATVAQACAAAGLPLIHVSTDYVFDGQATQGYRETDACNPQTVYGRSKLAGEQAVLQAHPAAVIVRTAWLHSPCGSNFVRTMLRLATERDSLRVVADQQGSPTYAPDLAAALLAMARMRAAAPDDPQLAGIFHLAGSGMASWHAVAVATMEAAAALGHRAVPVAPITTADYPTPAQRPAFSALDMAKAAQVYGITLPPWRDGVSRGVARLLAPASALPAS